MRFEDQRLQLVKKLKNSGISDPLVLEAFAKIPREDYVLPEYREYAYRNQPLPILEAQTISQPTMIALMLSELRLSPADIVLEIGTGSGYQTALLASIVKEVCSVELLDGLSLRAQKTLRAAGFRNLYFRIGDGWQGWQQAYPPYIEFNKIIVSAAADEVPSRLCEQLAEGGIMAVPVGEAGAQTLYIIHRENGELRYRKNVSCAFVPLVRSGR
ncbi:MAG: protein-L-isoaspartate(D-aspartate) O-methyltransferase [Candidatus Cloacimonetes bacterium]|jgi:protein-L-isoaspartate(D-aspartate) O-methyltransferase|nr:protein-L-isoaspartate(D-aspartate) O-methyltransferase [Candidatus Cloacimonadota bacterium]MDD2506750.1 protein-L-isoaspartate(D-aspartate) O-methyltransferase [Candidatus Cloacimonadota bacterium]MDD4147173.1 protein-L-isoaspartate(D-aspartate) O-methyltransferase [Candidatus Cloacimonadota bacterium]MDD4559382.1 protein-L-isoaspartate(D-aspartate) O-methyltransferase [Candidatus Cloacimonadota bacterium]